MSAGNGRRQRFTSVQLIITSLFIVTIGGWALSSQIGPSRQGRPGGGSMDTPIVISGGSIHFRAKNSGWTACTTGSTTCYEATFMQADKKNYQKFRFFNVDDLTTIQLASPTNGWEVDVVDTNPDSKHMVLVCAESSNFTSCSTGQFNTNNIYVIAVGGTFDKPDTNSRRLVYHDGDAQYDYISHILLDASSGSGTSEPCTRSRCALFLTP